LREPGSPLDFARGGLHILAMHSLLHRFLTVALAASTTTTVARRETTPSPEAHPATNWQVWVILVAVSALTGLAIKLVSDPPRSD
jgi:hypothetical protein